MSLSSLSTEEKRFTSAPPKCSVSGPCCKKGFWKLKLGWSWLSHRGEFHSLCMCKFRVSTTLYSQIFLLFQRLSFHVKLNSSQGILFWLEREGSTCKELLCLLNNSKQVLRKIHCLKWLNILHLTSDFFDYSHTLIRKSPLPQKLNSTYSLSFNTYNFCISCTAAGTV